MAEQPEANPGPNVIWVFGDQHRAQAVGYAGDPNVHTPNIDRLATEGQAWNAAVAGAPVCTPARGALLTSLYPHQVAPGHESPLPDHQPTVATAFADAGYRTAYFGKWHLGGFHERDGRAAFFDVPPAKRGGFEHWIGYENNNSQLDCWVHGDGVERYRLPGYETDALTDLLIDEINASAFGNRPLFAVLSVQPPHAPHVAPAEWMQRHNAGGIVLRPNVPPIERVTTRARRELAGYYAQIENLDWNLGRIRSALDAAGIADRTHIVFFSDHGDLHGSHGQFRKTSPWEESIRVPFIIGGPPTRYAFRGGDVSQPINQVDVAPTTLGLCGIRPPDWMRGTDYSAYRLLEGATPAAPDSAYLQVVAPTGHADSVDRPWRGVVTADGWKYVALEGQPWLMFNLDEDPYELANLAHNTRYAVDRRRLHDRLR